MTRYRYRYSVVDAQAAGVALHPKRDILLLAPDATGIEPVIEAECWLFCAETLAQLPPYVEVIGGLSTREEAAAAAAGLQVCPKCGEWLPVEWIDFECHGAGKHDVGAMHPTRIEVDKEFKQATVSAVAIVTLLMVVFGSMAVIAWCSN